MNTTISHITIIFFTKVWFSSKSARFLEGQAAWWQTSGDSSRTSHGPWQILGQFLGMAIPPVSNRLTVLFLFRRVAKTLVENRRGTALQGLRVDDHLVPVMPRHCRKISEANKVISLVMMFVLINVDLWRNRVWSLLWFINIEIDQFRMVFPGTPSATAKAAMKTSCSSCRTISTAQTMNTC